MPLVVGMTAAGATAELAEQPLEVALAYAPAKAGKTPGVVVSQDPRKGGLSAHDRVTIWVSKARYGTLPNFVGSSLMDVQQRRASGSSACRVGQRRGTRARSYARAPTQELPSRPACGSSSWSGTAHESRPLECVAPRAVGRPRDPDPRARGDLDNCSRGSSSNGA